MFDGGAFWSVVLESAGRGDELVRLTFEAWEEIVGKAAWADRVGELFCLHEIQAGVVLAS